MLGAVGCVSVVGPVRTADDYRGKATNTAESVVSALRTASLVMDVSDRDHSLTFYL